MMKMPYFVKNVVIILYKKLIVEKEKKRINQKQK